MFYVTNPQQFSSESSEKQAAFKVVSLYESKVIPTPNGGVSVRGQRWSMVTLENRSHPHPHSQASP